MEKKILQQLESFAQTFEDMATHVRGFTDKRGYSLEWEGETVWEELSIEAIEAIEKLLEEDKIYFERCNPSVYTRQDEGWTPVVIRKKVAPANYLDSDKVTQPKQGQKRL